MRLCLQWISAKKLQNLIASRTQNIKHILGYLDNPERHCSQPVPHTVSNMCGRAVLRIFHPCNRSDCRGGILDDSETELVCRCAPGQGGLRSRSRDMEGHTRWFHRELKRDGYIKRRPGGCTKDEFREVYTLNGEPTPCYACQPPGPRRRGSIISSISRVTSSFGGSEVVYTAEDDASAVTSTTHAPTSLSGEPSEATTVTDSAVEEGSGYSETQEAPPRYSPRRRVARSPTRAAEDIFEPRYEDEFRRSRRPHR
jgi:hypothetical protein